MDAKANSELAMELAILSKQFWPHASLPTFHSGLVNALSITNKLQLYYFTHMWCWLECAQ